MQKKQTDKNEFLCQKHALLKRKQEMPNTPTTFNKKSSCYTQDLNTINLDDLANSSTDDGENSDLHETESRTEKSQSNSSTTKAKQLIPKSQCGIMSSADVAKKKTSRSKQEKFAFEELLILTEEVKKNYKFLFGVKSKKTSLNVKTKIWKSIQTKINALGIGERSLKELKKRWYDLRRNLKTKLTSKNESKETEPELNRYENNVKDTFHPHQLHGIVEVDSGLSKASTSKDTYNIDLQNSDQESTLLDANVPSPEPQELHFTNSESEYVEDEPNSPNNSQHIEKLEVDFLKSITSFQQEYFPFTLSIANTIVQSITNLTQAVQQLHNTEDTRLRNIEQLLHQQINQSNTQQSSSTHTSHTAVHTTIPKTEKKKYVPPSKKQPNSNEAQKPDELLTPDTVRHPHHDVTCTKPSASLQLPDRIFDIKQEFLNDL